MDQVGRPPGARSGARPRLRAGGGGVGRHRGGFPPLDRRAPRRAGGPAPVPPGQVEGPVAARGRAAAAREMDERVRRAAG
eukprot:2662028-Lingulodinium_polyedra.AAC.1